MRIFALQRPVILQRFIITPQFTSSTLNGLTEFLIRGFVTGHKFSLCRSSIREQHEQGCATSGDEPGATCDLAQAVPSLTGCSPAGSEHGAEPGGHSNESHQQPHPRQNSHNQPVPRSTQQTRVRGRTGDRTTTWIRPEGTVRDRRGTA